MSAMASAPCPTLHVAINSLASYAAPRINLLRELLAAGVPKDQIHVFLGGSFVGGAYDGSDTFDDAVTGVRHYRVRHNSVDFTAMVHIVEHPRLFTGVRQWFHLHDTSSVGRHFWSNATAWCQKLPACALPLTRWGPSSSMGLYDAAFLNRQALNLSLLKNHNNASGMRWKQRGVGWEDKMFKVCDALSEDAPVRRFTRQCYNSTLRRRTCICSKPVYEETPLHVYGPDSSPRQAMRFTCADVTKYKANWARNRSMVIAP